MYKIKADGRCTSKFVLIFRVYLSLICCTVSLYLAPSTFYLTPAIQMTHYSRSVECQLVHYYESPSRVISTPNYRSVTSYKCHCVSTDEIELVLKLLK